MSEIPCRKCPECGSYHDLSVKVCPACSCNLESIPGKLVETTELPADALGQIDSKIKVYVQVCSACGTKNFTDNAKKPVKTCWNCSKKRVAFVVPEEFKIDDEEVPIWDMLLNKEITLSAENYGSCSFTLDGSTTEPYLLGRSAGQSEFLSNDGRVGREHCYLLLRDGEWYVKDNDSANGTFLNGRDLGLGGEHILADGDLLQLGHNEDSIAFRIKIPLGFF